MEEPLVSIGTVKQVVFITTIFQLLFSGSFFITSLVASNSCFLTLDNGARKCAKDPDGIEEIFGIYGGTSFELVVSAMFYIVFGVASLKLLRNPQEVASSSFNIGALFGLGIFVSSSSLFMAAKWGSISTAVNDFKCDELPMEISCPNESPLSSYTGIVVLSSFLFILHVAVTASIYIFRIEFINQSGPELHGYVAQTDDPFMAVRAATNEPTTSTTTTTEHIRKRVTENETENDDDTFGIENI
uniref:Uncharacterized protein n=1 Tax=Aplanochytrium stocchinoi TaxID=215587 RepID=A0A7S3LTI6_9STRA|mmetsp:Transcript_20267/g.24578  ORF Transcript_20267/g.24578 Transcript_20267/m.24578 type:complete len:244 (+) Transcript_20267:124-855(+)